MYIYKISNKFNQKVYVGVTVDYRMRWYDHKKKLKSGTHHNKNLQNDYEKFGLDAFSFELIEECDDKEASQKEKYWISYYDCISAGYNTNPGGTGIHRWEPSPEYRLRMSELNRGEKNGNYGRKWTQEMKKEASERTKGRYLGAKNPRATKVIKVETLEVFNTIQEAAIDIGAKNQVSITHALLKPNYEASGFHYAYYSPELYEYLKEHSQEYLINAMKENKHKANWFFDVKNNRILTRKNAIRLISKYCGFGIKKTTQIIKNAQEIYIDDEIELKILKSL